MQDYGIEITKAGIQVPTTDPRDMLLSSQYQMFKFHDDLTASVVLSPGDFTATASVTHGLGYVPAHIPYEVNDSQNQMKIVPSIPFGIGVGAYTESWADTDKIYFKVNYGGNLTIPGGWNELLLDATDLFHNYSADTQNYIKLGRPSGSNRAESAIRFDGVAVTSGDTLTSATVKIESSGGGGTDRVKWDTYGIDEDDTAAFTASNPLGRSRTTASVNRDIDRDGEASTGQNVDINVLSSLNEIRARGGWASGNAMAWALIENSGDNDNYFDSDIFGRVNQLSVLFTGDLTVNFRVIVFKDKISD